MYVTMQRTQPIRLPFPLFLVTVLTNKLVILTILYLQCGCCSYRGLFDCAKYINGRAGYYSQIRDHICQ